MDSPARTGRHRTILNNTGPSRATGSSRPLPIIHSQGTALSEADTRYDQSNYRDGVASETICPVQ